MKIVYKNKPPTFYADLTWQVMVSHNGREYIIAIGDEDIDNVEMVAESRIKSFELKNKRKACNLHISS